MTLLEHALFLAGKGFHIFPCIPNSKKPLIENWPNEATHDVEKITKWWTENPTANIGISTGRFNGGKQCLIVPDIDIKNGKDGYATLLEQELKNNYLPDTMRCKTPSGGEHFFYQSSQGISSGTNVLGVGVDIRSIGGYVVGPGSVLDGKEYVLIDNQISETPQWIFSIANKPKPKEEVLIPAEINQESATKRAIEYLSLLPPAFQGAGGDEFTFKAAANLKDIGVTEDIAFNLMAEHWNDRCEPPWDLEELREKVRNAYKYGKNDPGVNAPETQFTKISDETLDPISEFNKEFAFVAHGPKGSVMRVIDVMGERRNVFMDFQRFSQLTASKVIFAGNGKPVPVSKLWLNSPKRRTYDTLVFMPEQECPPNLYNLWTGFNFEPKEKGTDAAHLGLKNFLKHVHENICSGNSDHFNWVMSFMAHIIQKPWEKPKVALVLRGEKGVGKNIFVDCIGNLFKANYLVVADKRYLVSNFNDHLEKLLLFVLDEAFWSGDKAVEGKIKDLITGHEHFIEHKGAAPYTVKNLLRLVILGNEDWLVPASQDERRFAVFEVASGKKQDAEFFGTIVDGMKAGGYSLLLNYLKNYAISKNINIAPKTEALAEQKEISLPLMEQYWQACLFEGRVLGSDFTEGWPEKIKWSDLATGMRQYLHARNIKGRVPDVRIIGNKMRKFVGHVDRAKDGAQRAYKIPSLEDCRTQWEKLMGHKLDWHG